MTELRRAITYCLLLIVGATLGAQTTGWVEGSVYDSSGGIIAAASLRFIDTGTGAERSFGTDSRGRYLAYGLAPGVYRIEASRPGFRATVYEGLQLAAGRGVRLDLSLPLGEAREAVTVAASPPLVNTIPGDWGASIERRKLEELPLNGRDLFDLAGQEPGVIIPTNTNRTQITGPGTRISVAGVRPSQNSFRLDGVYINDATSSAPASAAGRLLGLEGIEELRLVTNPFGAEYGRAAGAVITAVSKSGSNQWHGSLYEFLRNEALDAKNFFDPAGERIPPRRRNQFGGLISGPLRRDRLFFLVNYEGLRDRASQTERPATLTADARLGRLPSSGGARLISVASQVQPYLNLYPLPNGRDFGDGTGEYIAELVTPTREDYAAGKIDVTPSERLRFSSRYTFDDADTSTPDPFKTRLLASQSRYQFVHTDTQYIPSPHAVHNLRVGFSRVWNAEDSIMSDSVPASLSFIQGRPLGSLSVVGLGDIGGLKARTRPRRFVVNDLQVNHEAAFVLGAHALRAGGGYDRVEFNQLSDFNASGFYQFDSVESFLQGRPRTGDMMLPGSDSARGWRQNQFFVFAQDEWRASAGLSLVMGLRYEAYSTPTEVNGKVATLPDPLRDPAVHVGGPLFKNPSKKNFAPRAALAWDPTGSGKTTIRAGAGLFFDLLGARDLLLAGVRMPPFFNRVAPASPAFPDLPAAAMQASPQKSLETMDFYPKQPYVGRFQLALQHQVGADAALEVGYVGARGVHLMGQLGEINTVRPEILPDGRLFFPAGAPRLNPAFDAITIHRTLFDSSYHGLLASVQRRWRGGFRFQARYAWAKSIDDTSSFISSEYLTTDRIPTMFDFRQNRGLSDFDLRHVFSANFSCQIPRPSRRGWGQFLGGWEIHGLAQAQTGHPFSPTVGFDRARLSVGNVDLGQRPDFVGPPGRSVILGDPQQFFDPLAFALPPAGMYGNLGRNTLTGPGLASMDVALHKALWRTERHCLRVRLEIFDALNHPNFQVPSGMALFNSAAQRLATGGRITATSTTSRQVQIAAKWVF